MSQVSILAIDAPQTVDSASVSSGSSADARSKNTEFSQLVAKHQQAKSGNNSQASGKSSRASVSENAKTLHSENSSESAEPREAAQTETISDTKNTQKDISQQETSSDHAQSEKAKDPESVSTDNTAANKTPEGVDKSVGDTQKSDTASELLAFIQAVDTVSTERSTKVVALNEKGLPKDMPSIILQDKTLAVEFEQGQKSTTVISDEDLMLKAGEQTAKVLRSNADNATKQAVVANEHVKSAEKLVEAEPSVDGEQANTQTKAAQTLSGNSSSQASENSSQLKGTVKQEGAANSLTTEAKQAVALAEEGLSTNHKAVDAAKLVEASEESLVNSSPELEVSQPNKLTSVNTASTTGDDNSIELEQVVKLANRQAEASSATIEPVITDNAKVSDAIANAIRGAEQKIVDTKAADVPSERMINQATAKSAVSAEGEQQGATAQKDPQQSAKDNAAIFADKVVNVKEQEIAKVVSEGTTRTVPVNEATTAITPQSIIAGEEFAIHQTAAKAQADSVSVQATKSAINIQNETIAIYRKDFSTALKDKVMVMVNQKIKQLDIRLDPPELGSMQVRLNLQNEQAAVSFVVQNQQAKEALEQNMDKLKHMLADSGVDVGDTDIEQRESCSDNQGESAGAKNGHAGQEEDALDSGISFSGQNLYKASATGVDYYA
ncbi:flagellar hook-length control protein FliK [Thalassotalea sp. G2M2-11]|uniref:flagellar hook-length control protein FliK n=1 Tax=Thalassotalea sp. G2M2-11 TaxID=2787627 RepID=UPI0019D0DDB0|nr:flagellar hook-length control protein FliK [Thalassotalea sp. G2M2-11]